MVSTIPEIIEQISPYYKSRAARKAKGAIDSIPEAEHSLVYDSSSETLEPVYFFILDMMNDMGLRPEKYVDNFTSSPGSGHFAELGQRATIMQQQASKVLGDINTVLRSIMNLIYDLKDFRTRLQSYEDLKSKDSAKSEGAKLSLKQIWMDKVDVLKGNSSIKAMTFSQAGYVTLIDAFLAAKDEKDAKNLDLNDRVKRIVESRLHEFNTWLAQSEDELNTRYKIEKNYLRSQVNSLKLYSRWAKPYLIAAAQLEQKEQGRNPALVKTFNTILLELTLMGKSELRIKETALSGDFPREFANEKFLRSLKRKYYSCVLIDFKFRGIPQRVSQQAHFTFGGRVEVTFRAYTLNEDELAKLNKEFEKSDITDVLNLVQGATEDSMKELMEEINYFLDEKSKEEKKKEGKKFSLKDMFEPFSALFGAYESSGKKEEKKPAKKDESEKPIAPDNWFEKEFFRKKSAVNAKDSAFNIFDIYKKSHGMASYT